MRFLIIAVLFVGWSLSSAQGGAAIITLVAPPPGGDGYSALQSGGAFPTGATSLYYNPALLSGLQTATGSQLHYSSSRQDLLPALNLEGLYQEFQGVSLVLPDSSSGFDVGIGFFRNYLNFGEFLSGSGADTQTYNAHESVYSFGVGVRMASPIHLGAAVKYYDSRLSSGVNALGSNGDGTATGWAFDLGLAVLPQFHPLSTAGNDALEINPSASLALQNMGPDAWYVSPDFSDPLPTSLRTSLGIRVTFADLVAGTFGIDWEKEVHRYAESDDPAIRTTGGMVQIFIFQEGRARLHDESGQRDEDHHFRAIELNGLQVYRIFTRLKNGDFTSSSESLDARYPFANISVFGISYRANPRFSMGKRWIEAHDNGIRDGQKALFFSLSL